METALDKLKRSTAWQVEPTLTEAELADILAASALHDPIGRSPADAQWTPTYDQNSAAAAAWLTKAGKASATVETDPNSFYMSSKVFDNCCRMAAIYRSAVCRSVKLGTADRE